jgi:hypothetical protein
VAEQLDNEAIDDAIATKVMGWYEETFEAYGNMVTAYYGNGQKQREKWAWQPTRQIGDAWKVLEKFERDGHDIFLRTEPPGWMCLIAADDNKDFTGYGETAMLAICRCALKAVGQPIATQGK